MVNIPFQGCEYSVYSLTICCSATVGPIGVCIRRWVPYHACECTRMHGGMQKQRSTYGTKVEIARARQERRQGLAASTEGAV